MSQDQTTPPRVPSASMVEAGRQAGDFKVFNAKPSFRIEPAHDCAEVQNIWVAMFDAWLKECQQHD